MSTHHPSSPTPKAPRAGSAGTLTSAAAAIDALTVGTSGDAQWRAVLLDAGATAADLAVWDCVRGTNAPFWSLGMRLSFIAETWPPDTTLRDAIGWLVVSQQEVSVHPATVEAWAALTPHGWVYAAAGLSPDEAATGSFTLPQVYLMAALRGIVVLPDPARLPQDRLCPA